MAQGIPADSASQRAAAHGTSPSHRSSPQPQPAQPRSLPNRGRVLDARPKMASWLKAAEDLLTAVDRSVQNATGSHDDSDAAQARVSDPQDATLPAPASGFGVKLGAIPFGQPTAAGNNGPPALRPAGSFTATSATRLRGTPTSSSTNSPAKRDAAAPQAAAAAALGAPSHAAPIATAAAPAPAPNAAAAAAAAPVQPPAAEQQAPVATGGSTTNGPVAPALTAAPPAAAGAPPDSSTAAAARPAEPRPDLPADSAAPTPHQGAQHAPGATQTQPPAPVPAAAPPPSATSDPPSDAAPTPAAAPSSSSSSGGGGRQDPNLARMVDTLRKRLDAYKGENQQLEDMLAAAEQRAAAHLAAADARAQELAALRAEQDALVDASAAAATAQDVAVSRLRQELDAANKQLAAAQSALAAVQQQHRELQDTKDSIEGGALEALRHHLSQAEAQLDTERRSHASTKAASASREADLEAQLQEGSGALAGMQRALEEAVARVRDLEQRGALMAAENSALQQQVAAAAESPQSQQPSREQLQLQHAAERDALQQDLAAAREQLAVASSNLAISQTQLAELQQQVEALRAAHQEAQNAAAAGGSAAAAAQQQQLKELLYQKQAQLERVTADKAAQQLLLERQVATLQGELGKAQAAATAARVQSAATGRGAAHDIIPMDALGEPYQRLARHNKLGGVVQASANFLDTTMGTVMQLLRQQPLARVAVFCYVVLIHLYVYFLIARMQRQALLHTTAKTEHALPGHVGHP